MFANLFSKRETLSDSGLFEGYTDMHAHILPRVDDGVRTMSESLEVLACMECLGVRTVWVTPHVSEEIPNTSLDLRAKLQELVDVYPGPIRLYLAAEYMLDDLFAECLATGDLLPLGAGQVRGLLVETSCFRPPIHFDELLERIKAKGYYPVLAHPERYLYMKNEDYERLKKAGVKFQLNLFSLAGVYGYPVRERALWLLKHGMYDVSGTDVHRAGHFLKWQGMEFPATWVDAVKNL